MDKLNFLVLGEDKWTNETNITIFNEKCFANVNLKHNHEGLYFLSKDYLWVKIDGVIWRGQFEIEADIQRHLLEIIKMSGAECINASDVTLNYGSNLLMHLALSKANIPVLKKEVLTFGRSALEFIEPSFPCVIRVGNYHMGYGKALIRNRETWRDFIDMAILFNQPISLEPYVDYKVDIRCQYITGTVKCIERKPSHWKANVCPTDVITFMPPEEVLEKTKLFARMINADIIALDWILNAQNQWIVLEGNTSPGLVDFDKDCQNINEILFNRLLQKQ